jgi:signal peptidase
MNVRELAEYALLAVAFVLVVSLVLGQLLGHPVLLGFVETGSMEPTLKPGDGFVAVPPAITGGVQPGDVVTFRAERLNGGGLTTHRVVARRGDGFITQGDANAVTDQAGGEPVVQRDQIVAEALQIGGRVIVIPQLGVLVTTVQGFQQQLAILLGTRALLGTQGIAYILFVFGILAYVFTLLTESRRRVESRDTRRDSGMIDGRILVVGLAVLLVVVLSASSVLTSGPQTFEVVSSVSDAPGPDVIQRGTSETLAYDVPSNGVLPVVVYLTPTTEGIEVSPERLLVSGGSTRTARVTLYAPEETGHYEYGMTEHRYVAFLPPGVIDALFAVHPWLPLVVTNLLLGGIFLGFGRLLVGWGPVRIDGGRTKTPLRVKIRRFFK